MNDDGGGGSTRATPKGKDSAPQPVSLLCDCHGPNNDAGGGWRDIVAMAISSQACISVTLDAAAICALLCSIHNAFVEMLLRIQHM